MLEGYIMYNVILVDDEAWSLNVSMKLFPWNEYGFEVRLATTKQSEALDYLDKALVDVILLDMCMPGISGEKMLKEIRRRNKKVKIVVLSGYSIFEYAQSAIDYGVFSYCLKPITEEKAQEVIIRLKESLDKENSVSDIITKPEKEIENRKFHQLIQYVENHYTERLYLNELTEKFELNLTYCCQLFKKHFNMGFNEYVTEMKMKAAVELIKNTNMEMDEIAEYLNYEYVYFCKLFKKKFNKTPRQYRIDTLNKR
ncbi:MAG: response regulator [Ruminococcaceae bacterium]|nr:response regulator [Oscillospiraceae bacterium]